MGLCESLNNSDITQSKSKSKIISNQNPYPSNRGPNLYNTPIKGNSFYISPNNISMSQSQLTLGTTILEHPFQRPQMHIYNNKSFQTSYINGNSMMNGNSMNKNSKLNGDSLSMSRSCGEIIIDGKINPEIKGNKDFENYIDGSDQNIDLINDNNNDNIENKNKRDINLYHRISKNVNNNNGNKNDKNK